MLLKVKSKDECLTIARRDYTLKFKRDITDRVSKDELLDYLPDDVFGTEQIVNHIEVDVLGKYYYVNTGWAIDELFVEEIIGEL